MKKMMLGLALLLMSCTQKSGTRWVPEEIAMHDQTYAGENATGDDEFLTVFTEEDQWHVVGIRKPKDKIQDVEFHRRFLSKKEASQFVADYLKKHNLKEKVFTTQAPGFVTEVKQAEVWPTKNQWSWEWEEKFTAWYTAEVNDKFFTKYNILVDCADVAYALRWIFSRINFLPAAAQLAATKELFTNESVKNLWKDLPTDTEWFKDKRFLTALNFVLENTYTHTLKNEIYPIAINKTAFRRGTIFLNINGGSGHTQNVIKAEEDGLTVPLQMMAASVPRMLTVMLTSFFQSQQPNGKDLIGFARFRWPVKEGGQWRLVDAEKMPHYSLEQYQPDFMNGETNFTVVVLKRLFPGFDFKKLLAAGVDNVMTFLKRRIEVVPKGFEYCQQNDCSPGTSGWEDFSTPSLDKKIREGIRDLSKFSHELANQYFDPTEKQEKIWDVWVKAWDLIVFSYKGKPVSLKELAFIWTVDGYTSDPRVSVEERWGIDSKFLASNIANRVQDILRFRLEKIKTNTCGINDCEPGSEKWMEFSTHRVDSELQYFEYNLSRACQYLTAENCDLLSKAMAKVDVKVEGLETLSLKAWLQKSIWLNADPRWDADMRWGAVEKKWRHQIFNPGAQFYRFKEKFLVRNLGKSVSIEDLESGNVLAWDNQFIFQDFNLRTGKLIARSDSQILIFDLNNQSQFRFDYKFKADRPVKWVSDTAIIASTSEPGFELISVENGKVQKLGPFRQQMLVDTQFLNINLPKQEFGGLVFMERYPPRWWIVPENDTTYHILDVLNPTQKITYHVNVGGGVTAPLQFLYWQTPKFFVVEGDLVKCEAANCKSEGKRIGLKVNKQTGASEVISSQYIGLTYPYMAIKEDKEIAIVKIDEDINVVQKIRSVPEGQSARVIQENIFEVRNQFYSVLIARVNSDSSLNFYPGTHATLFVTEEENLVTIGLVDKRMRIEDFSGHVHADRQRLLPTRTSSGISFSSRFYFSTAFKSEPIHEGMYVLGKHDGRPVLTGLGVHFSMIQPLLSTELPVFLGVNAEEINKVFELGGYRRPLTAAVPHPKFSNTSGVSLFRHQNENIWLAPEVF